MWELIHHEGLDRAAYRDARLHMIGAEGELCRYGASSKLNAEPAFLERLFDIGRRTATEWLDTNGDKLGKQSSWRPTPLFEESLEPAHLEPGARQKASPQ